MLTRLTRDLCTMLLLIALGTSLPLTQQLARALSASSTHDLQRE